MNFPVWKECRANAIILLISLGAISSFFAALAMVVAPICWIFVAVCAVVVVGFLLIYRNVLQCDILVDEQGISRNCKDKPSTFFRWEDIYEIRIIMTRSGLKLPTDFPILVIARRNILHEDKKHISAIMNQCDNASIIAVQHTKELADEIRKYYTKSIETERFY